MSPRHEPEVISAEARRAPPSQPTNWPRLIRNAALQVAAVFVAFAVVVFVLAHAPRVDTF